MNADEGAGGNTGDRRPTIHDVAHRAGVSRQTVTRAINDMSGISAATRDTVLRAAEELRYVPSRFGRGLVGRGQPTIGLMIGDLGNAFYPEIATALVRHAGAHGWNVVLAEIGGSDPRAVARDLAGRSDALVGYGVPGTSGSLAPARVPAVRLDLPAGQEDPGGVRFAFAGALVDLVSHLAAQGVHRPVVVDEPDGTGPSTRALELASALAPLTDSGDPADVAILEAVPSAGDLGHALAPTLDGPAAADLLLAWNDALALRTLKALRLRGVKVPEQVRVVGIDALPLGTLVTPELTTLGVDLDEVSRVALELVEGMYLGRIPLTGPDAVRSVDYHLVLRESA